MAAQLLLRNNRPQSLPSRPHGRPGRLTHSVLGISSSMVTAPSRPSRPRRQCPPASVQGQAAGPSRRSGSPRRRTTKLPRSSSQDGAGGLRGPGRPKEGRKEARGACAVFFTARAFTLTRAKGGKGDATYNPCVTLCAPHRLAHAQTSDRTDGACTSFVFCSRSLACSGDPLRA